MRSLAVLACLFLGCSTASAGNSTVGNLAGAAALTGAELLYCVQSGGDTKCTSQAVADANAINPLVGYNASGSTTTTTGSCSSSSNPATLTVGSATGWSVGQGIDIAGAGAAGADLVTSVTVIAGTTFTINTGCSTTVSGATVNHDDTAAISAAMTAAMAASKPLHLQAGTYNVTSGLTAVNSSLVFYGDGKTQSGISNRSTTANVFTIDYQTSFSPGLTTVSALFQNFGISQASGITPTAGAGFLIGSSTGCGPCTQYTSALTLQNIAMNGLWRGIVTQNGLIQNWFLNLNISQAVDSAKCGIYYNSPSPGGDNHWNDIEMTGTKTGLCIVQSDTQEFANLKTNGAGVVFSASAAANISRVRFVNPSIEGNGMLPAYAFDFGSNGATQVTIIGGEFGGTGTGTLTNTGNVTGGLSVLGVVTANSSFNASGVLNLMTGMPTSCSGQISGTFWNSSNAVNICP